VCFLKNGDIKMANNNASDFNLTRLSTKELSENLRASIEYGGNVFIVGRRGSGKTVISKEVIKETGFKEVYINL
jgi:Cdc6-like AAA superfamily ATPase